MEEINLKYTPIETLGYVVCDVPSDVFKTIEQEVQDMINSNFKQAVPYNKDLAGAIEKEFALYSCAEVLNKFFKVIIPEYWRLQGKHTEADVKYQLMLSSEGNPDLWVNLQKKYEFNPLHDHSGVLSFVMYISIPYSIEDEMKLPHIRNSNTDASLPTFSFFYPSLQRPISNYQSSGHRASRHRAVSQHLIKVDKDWVGKILIFPAWLQHMVTPFYTSDEYRISIAGNLAPVNNG